MSSETLQRQFYEHVDQNLGTVYRALLEENDANTLENFHLQNLATLSSRCFQVQQYQNSQEITNYLQDIEYLRTKLLERIHSLNDATRSSPIKRYVKRVQTGGRPKYVINIEAVKLLREQGFDWTKIGKILGVSASTIKRLRQDYSIEDPIQPYSLLADDDLDAIIKRLKQENPFFGIRMLMGALQTEGIKVTRQQLQNSIKRVDVLGNASRLIRTTLRRVYKVAGPNALWHIDGHHKLIRWKFVIHAGIDGYSRIITYIHCSGNNKSQTVFQYFRKGTHEFGIPSRVRADNGGENVLVEQFMNRYRGSDRGSFIKGKSVHNQRIERLWVDLIKDVIKLYSTVFNYLEEIGSFNIDNSVYMFCLHYVFLPRINQSLEKWKLIWNKHKIRTEGNLTPEQLFTKGMMTCGYRGMEDSNINPYEYGIDFDGPISTENSDNTVFVDEPRNILTQQQMVLLQSLVNPLEDDNKGYGINIYNKTVRAVANILRNNP
ncbi:hypothetical protein RclHR1_10040004 [Rhizophagus clarus]|uniref:Uncharacterized protein LOC114967080 n=1 Tax=Rhizophagus clarus TaxID=94130 RepID=A0A2Z6Q1L8_9GLOM|nr:hypothetical protein RclHR1_10040004 [Rhizophagus clarus]GES80834.1 uncharacterized protein LOC114967080 [Rhizophagus clarus]GES99679.1 uncharacterized protein LOC114967080 [Rhizophagus clarus]